VKTDTKALL